MYRTYSYKDMPVVRQQQRGNTGNTGDTKMPSVGDTKTTKGDTKIKKRDTKTLPFLGDLSSDEIIILAVAIILLADGCDDKLLIAALAFLFISDRL